MTKKPSKAVKPAKAKPAKGDDLILSPGTPHKTAIRFRENHRSTLIRYQNEWFAWETTGAYRVIEDETIMAEIGAFMTGAKRRKKMDDETSDLAAFNPKPSQVEAVYKMLVQQCHKEADTMAPPCFLDGGTGDYKGLDPASIISCRNGLLDIKTMKRHDPTPTFFTLTALPFDYDPSAPVPRIWLRFLWQVTKKRKSLVDCLQEAMGYSVTNDTSLQKVFFLWGRPRSGKGTILRVNTMLIGPLNTHHPSIQSLAGDFGLQGCIGKSHIQITDMDCDSRNDLSQAASKINAISGEDGVTVQRKNIGDWDGKLPGRIWLAGNNLPNFGAHAAATAARLIIFPFDVSFAGREDEDLTNKLRTELAGILNWVLVGLHRLRARTPRPHFIEPVDCKTAKTRMLFASDPVRGFGEERCQFTTTTAKVHKAVLYESYVAYCVTVGVHPLPMHTFSEKLSQAFPTVVPGRRNRGSDEKRTPIFVGIRLAPAEAVKMYEHNPDRVAVMGRREAWTIARDGDGWPIPASNRADDFED